MNIEHFEFKKNLAKFFKIGLHCANLIACASLVYFVIHLPAVAADDTAVITPRPLPASVASSTLAPQQSLRPVARPKWIEQQATIEKAATKVSE